MFTKGQRIEVEITDAADAQKCFGKLPEGIGVFVHGPTAVGDRVSADVFKIKPNYLEAKLVGVLSPSPVRVTPRCAHFGTCGGCKWQHVDYAEQLRMKRKMVADALAHIGGFEGVVVEETIGCADPFHYRNKIDLSFGDQRYLLNDERDTPMAELVKPANYALGFHAANLFSKVLDLDRCHIATEEMNTVLTLAKAFFRERKISVCSNYTHEGFLRSLVVRHAAFTGELMVYLITSSHDPALMAEFLAALQGVLGDQLTTFVNGTTQRKNSVAFADKLITVFGPGYITETLGARRFTISPNSFFQTNSRQALRLYEITREFAALKPSDELLDLYCGTGSIGIFCADACRKVVGFEIEAGSIRDAAGNAESNGVTNAEFHQLDMKDFSASLKSVEKPDVIITDPPRAGMHEKAVAALRAVEAQRIVYVSCNPASLARDAAALCAGGLYKMKRVQPVDLFPHTLHVESVAVLERG